MAQTSITLTHGRASDLQVGSGEPARLVLNKVTRLFQGAAGGTYPGATGFTLAGAYASGTVTFSASDGVITITINGVAVAEDVTGFDDTEAASLLVGAINNEPDPLVSGFVTSTSEAGVLTVTATSPGPSGNIITLAASGTGVTASGARLAGGTATTYTF